MCCAIRRFQFNSFSFPIVNIEMDEFVSIIFTRENSILLLARNLSEALFINNQSNDCLAFVFRYQMRYIGGTYVLALNPNIIILNIL